MLMEERFRDCFPHIMREVALKNFIYQVNGPEYIVYNKIEKRMVIIPADKQGINPQQEINNAAVFAIHVLFVL
jgi:hypothetical protein